MTGTHMPVTKLAPPDSTSAGWIPVDDDGHIAVHDLIDQARAPGAQMTVGFARLDRGASLDIGFPYDEVLIVTKGRYAVHTADGEEITAGAGEVIYLPADSQNGSHAADDTEIVYVAAPASVYADHVAGSAAAAG